MFVIIVLSEVFNEYQATMWIDDQKNKKGKTATSAYEDKKGSTSCVEYVSRWFLALIVPLLILWADQVKIDIEVIQQGRYLIKMKQTLHHNRFQGGSFETQILSYLEHLG